jgi:hypothetical protein
VDLPVYNETGDRLEFTIVQVSPSDNANLNLLTVRPKDIKAAHGQLRLLNRQLLNRVIVVTLKNSAGVKITRQIFLMQCSQRVSLRVGASEAYGDFAFETLTGRFTGCSFTGDWWVRATNMFGSSSSPSPLEASVERDGSFSLSGQMNGERHLLVVGKAKEPLKVINFYI